MSKYIENMDCHVCAQPDGKWKVGQYSAWAEYFTILPLQSHTVKLSMSMPINHNIYLTSEHSISE